MNSISQPTQSIPSFTDFGLATDLVSGATERGYTQPTSIQAQVIPVAMAGEDVLLQTGRGAGKTAAYGLALLHRLRERRPFAGLVLVPTDDLITRVSDELRALGHHCGTPVCGAAQHLDLQTLAEQLKRDPTLVVGSPDRVLDLHRIGLIPFDQVEIVVLDEADRMMDLGFAESLRAILDLVTQPHQTILIAETITPDVQRLAEQHTREPRRLAVDGDTPPPARIRDARHWYFEAPAGEKTGLLARLLKQQKPQSTLVFCQGAQSVDELAEFLRREGVEAHPLRPDAGPPPRLGRTDVLIASVASAHGIELGRLERVIHYDLTEEPADYVQHLDRLSQSHRGGTVWSLVTPDQVDLIIAIERHAKVKIERRAGEDLETGAPPRRRGRDDERPRGGRDDEKPRRGRDNERPRSGRDDDKPGRDRDRDPRSGRRDAEPPIASQGRGRSEPPRDREAASAPAPAPAPTPAPAPAPAPKRRPTPASPAATGTDDPSRFPGGVVPVAPPAKRMGGRVPTRRR